MRISDWSSDVCSSDLAPPFGGVVPASWPVERAGKREGDHGDIAGCDRLVFNPCADEVAQRRVDLAFHLAQAFRDFGGQRLFARPDHALPEITHVYIGIAAQKGTLSVAARSGQSLLFFAGRAHTL